MIPRGLLFALLACALMEFSCLRETPEAAKPLRVSSKNELVPYLDSLEHRYERACLQVGLANWNSYAKEGPYDLGAAKAALTSLFTDTAAQGIIELWRSRSGSLADKPLARRLELWHRVFMGGAIYADPEIAARENALQQTMTNFRFSHNGAPITRAQAATKLRQESKGAARRTLWRIGSQLTSVTAGDLASLVALRNAKARRLGFPNYYSLSLHLNAIDEEWLLKTLAFLEEETRPALEEFIARSTTKLRVKEFGPWDFDYALREAVSLPDKYFPSDSVLGALHRFETGIGFPVDSMPIREVVSDIPYGGLNLAIDIPRDTRFLLNPTKGHRFYAVAFHEFGHALKAVNTDVEYPILKGYEWIPGAQCGAYEEGVADMHSEFTDDSLWLAAFTAVKPKLLESYLLTRGLPSVYRLRRTMKDFFVEYEMYKNPAQNLDSLERAMIQRYLLVEVDSAERPQYASSIWYVTYPCYYQNYILADMIGAQLQEALSDKFGVEKISDPGVAGWITSHLYATGEKQEWTERIRNATGKGLEPGALLRKLGLGQSHLIITD
jgi:peptidyl-dipeptidase A